MHHLAARIFLPAFCLFAWAHAQELPPILLPAPDTGGGMPLMQALRERKTQREFRPDALAPEVLSNLLWAAFGVNRPENRHRTAPSAMNAQEIDVYVAAREGLYLYDALAHQLQPVIKGDLRGKTSGQDFAVQAPLNLIFVADGARMKGARPEQQDLYSAFDAGCISQNIYLFCASAGLATVVHDLDRKPLAGAMKLRSDQRIVFAQAVGFPK